MADRKGILPPRALLLSLLAQAPLVARAWPPRPAGWEIVAGSAAIVLGAVLNVWAERLFRRDGVGVCPFSPAPRLVSRGPYRFTRNPMYLGFVLLSLGPVLLCGVLPNALFPTLLLGFLHVRYVLPEEAFLSARLGPAYEEYRRTHARWLGLGLGLGLGKSVVPGATRSASGT